MIVELESDDMGTSFQRNGLHLTVTGSDQDLDVFRHRWQYCLGMPLEKGQIVGKVLEQWMLAAIAS